MSERIVRVESSDLKETEIGLIPKDWEVVRLGEVTNISAGGSAPQGEKFFNGNNPFIRVQHIDNESYKINNCDYITDEAVRKYRLKLFPKGTIVFPKSGATIYLEKRAMLPFDSYIVSHLCAVNSKIPELSQEFLFYALIKTKFAENKGDGYPTLNLSEVKNFKLPLPPLSEQKSIAYVLSTIQEAIEKTEQVIKATKELKKSLMKHLFTYGPVSLEDAQKVELKETEIGLIPKDWEVVRLINYVDLERGTEPGSGSYNKDGHGVRFLRVVDLSGSREDIIYTTSDNIKLCSIDDILITFDGSPGIVKKGYEGAYSSGIRKVSFKDSRLDKEFTYFVLQTNFVKNKIEEFSTGVTIKHASKSIPYIQIPLPPLHIQQKIAEILKTVDDKIQAEENKKKALESLFKSMLHNLITGKIRINYLEEET